MYTVLSQHHTVPKETLVINFYLFSYFYVTEIWYSHEGVSLLDTF